MSAISQTFPPLSDATLATVRAGIQQKVGETIKPLAYFFTKLTPIHQRYNFKLLVVCMTVQHFGHFLEGRPFTVYTDNSRMICAPQEKLLSMYNYY